MLQSKVKWICQPLTPSNWQQAQTTNFTRYFHENLNLCRPWISQFPNICYVAIYSKASIFQYFIMFVYLLLFLHNKTIQKQKSTIANNFIIIFCICEHFNYLVVVYISIIWYEYSQLSKISFKLVSGV